MQFSTDEPSIRVACSDEAHISSVRRARSGGGLSACLRLCAQGEVGASGKQAPHGSFCTAAGRFPSYSSLIESQNRSQLALLSARAKSHIRRCKPVRLAPQARRLGRAEKEKRGRANEGARFLCGILKLHFVRVLRYASHLSRFGLAFGILRPASPASRF